MPPGVPNIVLTSGVMSANYPKASLQSVGRTPGSNMPNRRNKFFVKMRPILLILQGSRPAAERSLRLETLMSP